MKTHTTTVEPATAVTPEGYSNVRVLGQGGGSVVTLVKRKRDGALFACKTPVSDNNDFARSAKREIDITAGLDHPAIVRASAPENYASESDLDAILLPFLRGKSLEDWRVIENPQSLANLLSSISIALYYLSLKGVAHGDIKPHNIIAPVGFGPEDFHSNTLFYPHIIDFSMAQLAAEEADERLGVGTLGFAAPETLRDGRASHSADMFSLGVLAFRLATGEHPFLKDSSDPAAITSAVREYSPPEISEIVNGFPAGLSQIILALMAKEPALRPENGFALCQELERWGATYPFRRALRPKHFLSKNHIGDARTIAVMPGFDLPASERLRNISDDSPVKLRMILESNFSNGNLRWIDGKISGPPEFEDYHWPRRLQIDSLKRFSQASLLEARWLIRSAVAGGINNLSLIEKPPGELRPAILSRSLIEALKSRITRHTWKQQSARLARSLDTSEKHAESLELCARLYVQAGELPRAVELIEELSKALKQAARETELLPLLQMSATLAEKQRDVTRLIELLHREADIRKDIGDTQGAEEMYLRIIKLSGQSKSKTLAETYKDLGDIYKLRQKFVEGIAALNHAHDLYAEMGDMQELARVTNNLGNIYWINADFPRALHAYREALRLHRKRDNLADISSTVNNIASIYAVTGRISRAIRIYSLCLELKRQVGDQGEIARTLNNLGYTYYLRGEVESALEALSEALQINRKLGSKKEILFNLDNISSCAITAGRFAEALSYLREGRELTEDLHDHPTRAILDLSLAKIFTRTGRWRHAERLSLRSLKFAQDEADRTLTIQALLQLADLKRRTADTAAGADFASRALATAEEIGDKQGQLNALLLSAEDRINAIRKALNIARAIDSPRDVALCNLNLSEELLLAGDSTGARMSLTEAGEYFEEVSHDLEKPRYLRSWSEFQLTEDPGNFEAVAGRMLEALDSLVENDQRADFWLAGITLSEASLRAAAYEQGYAAIARSMQTVKELIKELPDKNDEKRFLSRPEFKRVSQQIQKLREALHVD